MNSIINFVELDNRVVSATYRHLMVKAKVVLVEEMSGVQLPDPVTTIVSPLPSGPCGSGFQSRSSRELFPEGAERARRIRGPKRRFRGYLTVCYFFVFANFPARPGFDNCQLPRSAGVV